MVAVRGCSAGTAPLGEMMVSPISHSRIHSQAATQTSFFAGTRKAVRMQAASHPVSDFNLTLNEGLHTVSAGRCARGPLLRGPVPHCNIHTEFYPRSRTLLVTGLLLVPLARMSGVECNSTVESFQHRLARPDRGAVDSGGHSGEGKMGVPRLSASIGACGENECRFAEFDFSRSLDVSRVVRIYHGLSVEGSPQDLEWSITYTESRHCADSPTRQGPKMSSAGEPVLERRGALGWTAGAMHTICHLRVLALACCSSLERAPWLGLATAESIESGLVTPAPAGMQRRPCMEAGHFSRTRRPQPAPLRALQMPIAMATLQLAQCEPAVICSLADVARCLRLQVFTEVCGAHPSAGGNPASPGVRGGLGIVDDDTHFRAGSRVVPLIHSRAAELSPNNYTIL